MQPTRDAISNDPRRVCKISRPGGDRWQPEQGGEGTLFFFLFVLWVWFYGLRTWHGKLRSLTWLFPKAQSGVHVLRMPHLQKAYDMRSNACAEGTTGKRVPHLSYPYRIVFVSFSLLSVHHEAGHVVLLRTCHARPPSQSSLSEGSTASPILAFIVEQPSW
jgi:hypothetical protein